MQLPVNTLFKVTLIDRCSPTSLTYEQLSSNTVGLVHRHPVFNRLIVGLSVLNTPYLLIQWWYDTTACFLNIVVKLGGSPSLTFLPGTQTWELALPEYVSDEDLALLCVQLKDHLVVEMKQWLRDKSPTTCVTVDLT